MKGNSKTKSSTKKVEVESEKKGHNVEEKKKVHGCDQCRWYDFSTQREFHRDGIRKGLVETRAVCRSPKSKARNHLVKKDSDKPCFEKGKYVTPKKPEKKTKKKSNLKDEESMTSPQEYFGSAEGRLEAQTKSECPKCGSDNVRKSSEDSDGKHFECLDCGEEWKRALNGTVY